MRYTWAIHTDMTSSSCLWNFRFPRRGLCWRQNCGVWYTTYLGWLRTDGCRQLAPSQGWLLFSQGRTFYPTTLPSPGCFISDSPPPPQGLGFSRRGRPTSQACPQAHKMFILYDQEKPQSPRSTDTSVTRAWWAHIHTHTSSLQQKWPKLGEVCMSLEMISFACFKSALVCTACSSKFTLQKADSFFHILFT